MPRDRESATGQNGAIQMRYDPTIRVTTVFFSALVGFGLKHLLDADVAELAPYRWACFLLAMFTFLRFLLGSANHLWFEYVSGPDKKPNQLLISDIIFLVGFGVLALFTCYSHSLTSFLCRSLYLPGAALIWGGLDNLLRKTTGQKTHGGWTASWILINSLQVIALLGAVFTVRCLARSGSGNGVGWLLWGLALFSFALFVWDIAHQLEVIQDPKGPENPAGGPIPAAVNESAGRADSHGVKGEPAAPVAAPSPPLAKP
jgi:hypothetical protein